MWSHPSGDVNDEAVKSYVALVFGLGGSKLHIRAFERTKGIHHLMGPKAGDTLRRCRLGILILGHRQCARH